VWCGDGLLHWSKHSEICISTVLPGIDRLGW
jgi:hypothetical protein